jgi:hypothetical protein
MWVRGAPASFEGLLLFEHLEAGRSPGHCLLGPGSGPAFKAAFGFLPCLHPNLTATGTSTLISRWLSTHDRVTRFSTTSTLSLSLGETETSFQPLPHGLIPPLAISRSSIDGILRPLFVSHDPHPPPQSLARWEESTFRVSSRRHHTLSPTNTAYYHYWRYRGRR